MDKKLPSVFANKIEKELTNNEKVYVAKANETESREEKEELSQETFNHNEQNINQKIRAILNSRNYIYKAKVEITQNGNKLIKNIIGKNGNQLITIDNEIIPIDSIEDIKIVQENS